MTGRYLFKIQASLALLLIAVSVLLCSSTASAATKKEGLKSQYVMIIDDDADLLSREEETELFQYMEPLTAYGNVIFWTTYDINGDEETRARNYLNRAVGDDLDTSSTLFMIDMGSRQLWIQSRGQLLRYISITSAYNITANVSEYATQRDYADCAKGAFTQMLSQAEGGRVPSPMRVICTLMMSLFGALLLAYKIIHSEGSTRVSDPLFRNNTAHSDIKVEVLVKKLEYSKTTPIPKDTGGSSCSCGSSCGGSSCGSSCGGGGGSGF